MQLLAFSVAVVASLTLAGCGPKTNRQPVSGRVAFDGQPLEQGSIQFILAEPAGMAGGARIDQGSYSLPGLQGLEVGKYKVSISSPEIKPPGTGDPMQNRDPSNRERIPVRYNTRTELTAEVIAEGPNSFDFDLKP